MQSIDKGIEIVMQKECGYCSSTCYLEVKFGTKPASLTS